MNSHILIVEDEIGVQQFAAAALKTYHVHTVATISSARAVLREQPIDLLLLDLQLAGENGMDLAREVRQHHPYVAVVILTGQGTLQSAVEAIAINAHYYLLKPVTPAALRQTVHEQIQRVKQERQRDQLARHMQQAIEAITDAPTPPRTNDIVKQVGSLRLDRSRYEATYAGSDMQLSGAQFRVLWRLVKAEGEAVAPTELVREGLGYEVSEAEAGDLIKGYISQIRRKLAIYAPDEEFIRTIRGKGYLWLKF